MSYGSLRIELCLEQQSEKKSQKAEHRLDVSAAVSTVCRIGGRVASVGGLAAQKNAVTVGLLIITGHASETSGLVCGITSHAAASHSAVGARGASAVQEVVTEGALGAGGCRCGRHVDAECVGGGGVGVGADCLVDGQHVVGVASHASGRGVVVVTVGNSSADPGAGALTVDVIACVALQACERRNSGGQSAVSEGVRDTISHSVGDLEPVASSTTGTGRNGLVGQALLSSGGLAVSGVGEIIARVARRASVVGTVSCAVADGVRKNASVVEKVTRNVTSGANSGVSVSVATEDTVRESNASGLVG